MGDLLAIADRNGVRTGTVNNPPVNVMTIPLLLELLRFANEAAVEDAVRAVVLRSANPDWFIAHFDVGAILTFPTDGAPARETEPNAFHAMCETMRTMPKPTICAIGGRVGGGGAELSASCDMRFGTRGKTILNQMEVALGILPGGTGTQRIPRLVGRGRALEIILGSVDIDAETLESWGWLNRALPPGADLDGYVDQLAARIAAFPPGAVARAKASVLNADSEMPLATALTEEALLFQQTLRDPEAQRRLRRFLELGGQTPNAERRMGELCGEL